MTPDIALTLAIIISVLILFATDKFRVDLVALMVLLTVTLTGLVSTEEAFAGFANPAVITVWAVYIVSGGMFKTGVAEILGRFIVRLSGNSEMQMIVVIMLICGIISAFINNVGAVAMLLPAVVSAAHVRKISVSRLLIPLSFSSLLGGSLTLIGTPANILATSILADHGLPTFDFFDFTGIGAILFAVGIIYMALAGRRLLPIRQQPSGPLSARQFGDYFSEVRVLPESKLGGCILRECGLGAKYDLTVTAIMRGGKTLYAITSYTSIHPGDVLVLRGPIENVMKASEEMGLALESKSHPELENIEKDELHLVEATLAPRSHIVNSTLGRIRFRDRYGFTALAIRREGEVITRRLRDVRLRFGDALVLQGPEARLPDLQEGNDFLVLEPVAIAENRRHKMPVALGIMALVIGLALFAGLHIATAMVIGAVLMVLTRCLSMEEAHESIDWRTVFLVAGMLPLGTAMENTGTARYIADLLLGTVGEFGPIAMLAGVYILAAAITQSMSNAAAIVLIVPIALDTAAGLGANHFTFTLAVVIGAATSFLTPVGHKANVLIFGPGGYKFTDYARVGGFLTVLLLISTLIFLPRLFPLFP